MTGTAITQVTRDVFMAMVITVLNLSSTMQYIYCRVFSCSQALSIPQKHTETADAFDMCFQYMDYVTCDSYWWCVFCPVYFSVYDKSIGLVPLCLWAVDLGKLNSIKKKCGQW